MIPRTSSRELIALTIACAFAAAQANSKPLQLFNGNDLTVKVVEISPPAK